MAELPEPQATALSPVSWLAAAGHQLWVGRFNGAVAGALWLRSEGDQIWLEYIAVRRATRRRGVARRMLDVVNPQVGQLLAASTAETSALLARLSFVASDDARVMVRVIH